MESKDNNMNTNEEEQQTPYVDEINWLTMAFRKEEKELQENRMLEKLYASYLKSKIYFTFAPDLASFYQSYAKAYHEGNTEVLEAPLNFEQKRLIVDFAIVHEDLEIASFILKKGAILQHCWSKGYNIFELGLKFASLEIAKLIVNSNNHGFTLMHLACLRGDLDTVEQLVLEEPDLVNSAVHFESVDWPGFTPLHFALVYEHKHLFATLLDNGADISIEDADSLNPIQRALLRTDRERMSHSTVETITTLLLDRNVFVINSRNLTLLHIACMMSNFGLALKVIEIKDIQVDSRISSSDPLWPDYTPLHIAATLNKIVPADILLKNGADYTATVKDSKTALHLAFEYGHKDIVDLIWYYHKGVSNPTDGKLSHLDIACARPLRPNQLIVERFLKNGHQATESALLMAFKHRRANVIRLLVKYGCDISAIQEKSFQGLSNKSHKMIRQLITWKVWKPEHYQSHEESYSLLHVASSRGYAKVVRVLLEQGVDPNGDKLIDETPLYLAISENHVRVIKLLLDYNADPSYSLNEEFNVFRKLVQPKSSHNIFFHEDRYRKFYNQVIEMMIEASVCDLDLALHYSVLTKNPLSSEVLLQHGANVNYLNCEIDLSCEMGTKICTKFSSILGQRALVKLFYDHFIMLKSANLHVNSAIYSTFKELFDFCNSNTWYGLDFNFVEKCENECQLLKETKIYESISLYDILSKDTAKMSVINSLFEKMVTDENFHEKFVIYGYLLKAKYKQGLLRKALIEPAHIAFQSIVNRRIPDLCLAEICKYLSNRDLKILTKV